MADRFERLTNLLALLLETPRPLSLHSIAQELEGQYPENLVALRGAFERDKSTLRDIGVPIEQEMVVGSDDAGQSRYWVDRDRYELSDLELDDDERRALQMAMAATRPGSSTAQEALWKLGAGLAAPGHTVTAVVPDDEHLAPLRDAVATRTTVQLRYGDLERTFDPWGLLLREGFWYVVGFDHSRNDRRTYRLDRIQSDVELVDGVTFERPAGFKAADAFPADPKLIGLTDSVEAHVLVDRARAAAVAGEVGPDRVIEQRDDGSVVVAVPAGNTHAFRAWLVDLLDHAEVLGPPEVRQSVIDWLSGLVAAGAAS